jgi:cob(I)alamin adenosyltransferase
LPRKPFKGIVEVYTGNGKGKTTAALGLALRALGHGMKVYIIQFMKGSSAYGELKSLEKFKPNVAVKQFGRKEFVDKKHPTRLDFKLAREALEKAKKVVASGKWDLVILDEINVALNFKLIGCGEVLDIIRSKPSHVELVLTGRYAPKEILDIADLVSEVKEIKHPYRSSRMPPRVGIEY